MRPLRLELTAFGPYAGTEVIDFDALTELGLFVVAGNNGSGKTTIFDALHYALYGTLPGRRATYVRLKSDHAADSIECCVTFDFAAHGAHWRVTRSPKQQRPKRRGTGFTEAPAAATLFKIIDGTASAQTNRLDEVRAKCTELIGLTGKQFERVALLPQGEFSRVLTESATDRRELLRTLFSSEIFDDATSLLADRAAKATAADRSVLERLDHQQSSLADQLVALIGEPVPDTWPAMQAAIDDFRQVRLAALATSVGELETRASQARQAHLAAVDLCERIRRRSDVRVKLEAHEHNSDQHRADLQRLNLARAAVPVAGTAQSLASAKQRSAPASERVAELHTQLNAALRAAGVGELSTTDASVLRTTAATVAALGELLADRSRAALRIGDLDATIARFHAEVRRAENEIRSLGEQHETATRQLRQTSNELAHLAESADIEQCEHDLRCAQSNFEQRRELADAEAKYGRVARQATELDAQIASIEHALHEAHAAHADCLSLQHKADAALAAHEASCRRHKAATRYQQLAANLVPARQQASAARARVEELWDAFIVGTAARISETLIDDEPCPVCGSAEHPAPANHQATGDKVTEAEVAAARERAEAMQTNVRSIEAEIESLQAIDADIASLSPSELGAEIATTKAMALGARTVADQSRQMASTYDQLSAELAVTRDKRTTLDAELRSLDQRQARLHGALGESANEPVSTLQQVVDRAARARADAEQLQSRRDELGAQAAGIEDTIEAVVLGQIAAENRRMSAQDQLEQHQSVHRSASQQLASIDDQLEASRTSDSSADLGTDDAELRTQACRQANGLLAELTTAVALSDDAAEHVRRGQSILRGKLNESPFDSVESVMASFLAPAVIEQLVAQTEAHIATGQQLHGQLLELADLPDTTPDVDQLGQVADHAAETYAAQNRILITTTNTIERIEADLLAIRNERASRQSADLETRRLERVAAMAKGDNERNTSFENWVLAAHLRDVVQLANIRLARSTHQRFQLCVLDDGENKRGRWGLDLGVEDTVTGTRRPTAGLSGGELFQASLALALGLADAVMNQSAGVRIDALFIDEGFGSLDETSVERAIDLLDELRDRGAMVGVITHVPALLDALPLGIGVIEAGNGQGSTIRQSCRAA